MKALMNRVKKLRKMAKAVGLEKTVYWCDQAIYMIDTYSGTEHEAVVKSDIERVLAMFEE